MKTCRFCSNEIPFYGGDTCESCLKRPPNAREAEQSRVIRESIARARTLPRVACIGNGLFFPVGDGKRKRRRF